MDSEKTTARMAVDVYRSMVDAGVCCSIEEINDLVLRAASLRPVPKIVERISALEDELTACKSRLQILEAQKRSGLFGRLFVALGRLRMQAPIRLEKSPSSRGAQS